MKKYLILAAVLTGIDQGTKYLAEHFLKSVWCKPLIPGVLELQYLQNRGAAFGMMKNFRCLFVFFAFAVVALCILAVRLVPGGTSAGGRHFSYLRVCLSVLGAGAAGNLIDRLVHGYVTDFIYIKIINFPVFNFADICVSVSVFVLVLLILFYYKEEDYHEFRHLRQ